MSAKIFRNVFNNASIHSSCRNQRGSTGGVPQRPPDWYDGQSSKNLRVKIWLGVILAHAVFLAGCNEIDAAVDYTLDQNGFRRHIDTSIKMCEYKLSQYRSEFRPCPTSHNK